jgi:hypothetical protein
MSEAKFTWTQLGSQPLCVADFRVEGAIMSLGRSPFTERRVGYVTGGDFRRGRLSGEILPGGGNWPTNGRGEGDKTYGTFDARAIWKTHDGAPIYLTYTGRSVISDAVAAQFRDPSGSDVHPSRYYIRIALVFETADPRYEWLNGVLAVGCGQRMSWGIRHWIFEVT